MEAVLVGAHTAASPGVCVCSLVGEMFASVCHHKRAAAATLACNHISGIAIQQMVLTCHQLLLSCSAVSFLPPSH
jgi:hypothetical protein